VVVEVVVVVVVIVVVVLFLFSTKNKKVPHKGTSDSMPAAHKHYLHQSSCITA